MKNSTLLVSFLFTFYMALGQNTVSGRVVDKSQNPIVGANVYLDGTYDGASTDADGRFSFTTGETGTQTLVVSALAYESLAVVDEIEAFKNRKVVLTEAINELTGVTLTAGTFEAGDNSKVTALKPLDIVTTAGAAGDFVAALQTLPGTTTVNEDGRLFVRGGTAGETQVFIDGLRVFQPFNATVNAIPTRGRFSPFLFKGITFSTGGYSAEYGQALSSVLLLNTTDVPDQEKTDVSIMTVGGGVGHTKIWGKESLSINTQYINLSPYESLIPSTRGMRWTNPYESLSGEAVFRHKGEQGIFKLYTGLNHTHFDLEQEDINAEDLVRVGLRNNNLYLNSSYNHFFGGNWSVFSGTSVSRDSNTLEIEDDEQRIIEKAAHLKLRAKKGFSSRLALNVGTELLYTNYDEVYSLVTGTAQAATYEDVHWGAYLEGDLFLSNDFALKLGGRMEYTSVLNQLEIAPRLSLAYKSGEFSQFSLAYGQFYQNPLREALRFENGLQLETASHHILNYQYANNGKTLRAEGYYKGYQDLLKYDTDQPERNSLFNNDGSGHAAGFDLFWRDNSTIANLDYWVSYSYLDTERDHRNFTDRVTPDFAQAHNVSVVTKYWWEKLRSQVGISYSFASGRPYDNPNTPQFMAERTKSFNNLSLNWAYLIDQQKILYFSVNNVLGFTNVSGYQYANAPNVDGVFDRRAKTPPADSFFFVGFFWTLSDDKKSNQLDNL